MIDFTLRLLLLIVFSVAITLSIRGVLWTIEPWWQSVTRTHKTTSVRIDPVGLIEGGKVQKLQGAPISRKLSHRLAAIMEALRRDLTEEYATVQRHLNVSFPEASAQADVAFSPFISGGVDFEAKVFNVDVIGIGRFFYQQLHEGDSVQVLIEVADTRTRTFVEIDKATGEVSHVSNDMIGDVHEVIERIACDVAHDFLAGNPSLKGMTKDEFCEFQAALDDFQGFIIDTAAAVEHGASVSVPRLEEVIDRFESPALTASNAAVIHLSLASLYKLQGDLDKAIDKLQFAGRLDPANLFVTQNLSDWLDEQRQRDERRQIKMARVASSDERKELYNAVRSQPALSLIGLDAMRDAAKRTTPAQEVIVAALVNGYSPGAEPEGDAAEILPVEVLREGTQTEDEFGFGNMVVNLLAALAPSTAIKVLPIKVLDNDGVSANETIAAGIDRAVDSGANVLLIPLGGMAADPFIATAIERAVANGVIPIAAAGNTAGRPGNVGEVTFPAALTNVIAVGAVNLDGTFANFSPGPVGVDINLPGVAIITVGNDGVARENSGTSFSNTIAAAIVASVLLSRKSLSVPELRAAIAASSSPLTDEGPPVLRADLFYDKLAGFE